MSDSKPPRCWTEDEMRTWVAHGDLGNMTVHMFPCGTHPGYPSVCGAVTQREGVSEEDGTAAPLEDWGNGNKDNTLCTACLDAWWNGPDSVHWARPTHPVERRFTDEWVYPGDKSVSIHLTRTAGYAACGIELHTRITASMATVLEDYRLRKVKVPGVCHTCAVIWDAQCARDAGMDASEGRGWGTVYGDGFIVHRFWHLDVMGLDTPVELTHCTPHRAALITVQRGTLDEWVNPEPEICPVCLTTDYLPHMPQGVVVTPEDEAEAEVPEQTGPPVDLWGRSVGLYHWVSNPVQDDLKQAPACSPDRRFVQVPFSAYAGVLHRKDPRCDTCDGLYRAALDAYRDTVKEKAQEVRKAAQKAVQERESPAANRLAARIANDFLSFHRAGAEKSPFNAQGAQKEADHLARIYLGQFAQELAAMLEDRVDDAELMAEFVEVDGQDGNPDRHRGQAYRDAARWVREYPILRGPQAHG